MLDILVVAPSTDQRTAIVDAVCELPGVLVGATAGDVHTARRLLSRHHYDIVIGTSSLTCGAIGSLVEAAHDLPGTNVIVQATESPLLPGLTDYWRDLGARHVVDTIAELTDCVAAYAQDGDRSRRLAAQLEATLAIQASGRSEQIGMSRLGVLLSGADRQARTPQVAALAPLVLDTLRAFRRSIPDDIEIFMDVPSDLPRVRCVSRELERILLHLLLAARDAIPLGGQIWLVAERDGPRHVRIELLESSGRARDQSISLDVIRALATKQQAEVHVVDHASGATSIQVVLPAVVPPPN
jgi:signal transduction histidine kinase